ncbi:MAG: GNAT family N-acetyltransferase [Nocardioides sp.]|uniref:GNAT family N-acetyltransferase n=1 Tax=Nocardioides sp. TaxID=35761 RepID=UPI002394D84F|nr:GNAT family N-acetyltransferase [Nocardioides sp.]MDE0776860.1 GNAT family N-acetyltransferase [Nocardioides sp.]
MTSASIRPARPSDLRHLAGIEDAGGVLFEQHLGPGATAVLSAAAPSGGERDLTGTLLVAVHGGAVVGFAHLTGPDGHAHLEQVSVLPSHGRRGIGTALVGAVMEEARWSGHDVLSLCTYADVPWNGPFYRSLGFVEVEDLEPFQVRLRRHERALGLDEVGRRVVMRAQLRRPGRRP